MSQAFDADAFMNQVTESAGDTTVTPIPADTYVAMIDDVKVRTGNKDGRGWVSLDISYMINDDSGKIAAEIGRPPKLSQGVFLDVSDSGGLDMGKGKNVTLNRLREAVDQNRQGVAWAPPMLKGAGPLKIVVTQEPDKSDSTIIYNRVKSFGKV